ncbi:MAG TPA: inositol 2-dehydrogenase, partial [Flexilinea sp.]|nr:inositol 2-dehydrogenase [Flexilinea sp.]
ADYHAILNDPTIQAVLICSPTNTHADIAMEAARAGKHIFCEKPVDQTVSKILETKKLVEENAVKMQIGFNRRFDHNFRKIKKLRDDGTLGEIQIIRITSRDPEPPSPEYAKTSGGMFLDMTIHDFDMACYQANSEVDEVYAMGAVTVDPEIGKAGDIDTAIVTLKFKNGAMAVIDNCRKAVYGYDQRVEVFGTNGAAASENDRETMVKISSKDAVCEDKPLFFFLERYMQSFRDEIKSFINAILNDRPVEVNIDDGLRPILIAIAANKSMKENRPVKISEVMEG